MLSFYLVLEDGRCQITINIARHTSTYTSWYEIWAATVAMASMCTRWKGKGGKARGLGKFFPDSRVGGKNLYVV